MCQGSADWHITLPYGSQHDIEGFTVPASVNVGQQIKLYTSTTAATYQFQIFRMGWYQGLGGRLMYTSPTIQGIAQPPPLVDPATKLVSCANWHDPVAIDIPSNWVSGEYVIKMVSSQSKMRYVSFIVRNDASHAASVFQSSIFTAQAYNDWDSQSLYHGAPYPGAPASAVTDDARSYAVTFDRPFSTDYILYDFSRYEYDFIRWLEREGFDVTYSTDLDTHERGGLLLNHQLFMSVGHDEYWSTAMRQNVESARAAGISLAFFGANDMYWHIRLADSSLGADRVIICYKSSDLDPLATVTPSEATVEWRSDPLNKPEDAVLGEMYHGQLLGTSPLIFLNTNISALFIGTSLFTGTTIPELIGPNFGPTYSTVTTGEFDTVYDDSTTPPGVQIITASPVRVNSTETDNALLKDTATATLYEAPSGARVFDAGTFWWSAGLDNVRFSSGPPPTTANQDMQRFTANLLRYLMHA